MPTDTDWRVTPSMLATLLRVHDYGGEHYAGTLPVVDVAPLVDLRLLVEDGGHVSTTDRGTEAARELDCDAARDAVVAGRMPPAEVLRRFRGAVTVVEPETSK